MSAPYEIPTSKRLLPWGAGLAAGLVVWQALLQVFDASGTLAIYVAAILGFNAYALVAAGVARPVEEEEEESFLLKP